MISLQFLLTALVVVIAPGTDVAHTRAGALAQGRRPAPWAALGWLNRGFAAIFAALGARLAFMRA